MRKVWHPYWLWEDWQAGMWDRIPAQSEREQLAVAIEFTGNAELYGSFMRRVVAEWPIACEHNLTDGSLNKQAWLGHAACALAHRLPEYIVRRAWGMLTDQQRDDANMQAAQAAAEWTRQYRAKEHGQTNFVF